MYWTPDPDHPLTKICSKCRQEKHLMEFYLRYKDGRRWRRCKECVRAERRRHYAANGPRCREQNRRSAVAHPERAREQIRRWKRRHPERIREASKRYYRRHPGRNHVRHVSRGLLHLGLLEVADECADCGGSPVELHHLDYTDPYNVVPLCRRCHMRRHHAEWRRTGGGPVKYPEEHRHRKDGQQEEVPADSAD